VGSSNSTRDTATLEYALAHRLVKLAQVAQTVHGETPLLQIIKARRLRLMDWLIANGADINFQDARGYSALHHAISRKFTAVQVKMLLDRSANPLSRANDGSTAISLAKDQSRPKLVALLQEYI
jgi:ankyrin repeat protein